MTHTARSRLERYATLLESNGHRLTVDADTHIETDFLTYEAANDSAKARICCASDAPYGLQVFHFAGYRALLERHFSADVAQRYLGGNAATFYASACRSVLGK